MKESWKTIKEGMMVLYIATISVFAAFIVTDILFKILKFIAFFCIGNYINEKL